MRRDQRGNINILLIPLIVAVLLLIGAGSFAIWAFGSRQDYKNNTDQKIAAAESITKTATQTADAQQYAQAAKYPLKSYVGPQAYGSITIKYPKTWGAYVDEEDGSGTPLNGYFQPNFVPSITDQTNVFALRMQMLQESYSQVLANYTSQATAGTATVKPFNPSKVPSVTGVEITGQVQPNNQGVMIVLPLRTYTLELWTESSQYVPDFNNIILPNFSFSP